jgi:hypothetical protein
VRGRWRQAFGGGGASSTCRPVACRAATARLARQLARSTPRAPAAHATSPLRLLNSPALRSKGGPAPPARALSQLPGSASERSLSRAASAKVCPGGAAAAHKLCEARWTDDAARSAAAADQIEIQVLSCDRDGAGSGGDAASDAAADAACALSAPSVASSTPAPGPPERSAPLITVAPLTLEWRGLGCSYNTQGGVKEVLADVWGAAAPGEMQALLGPSGAGKSTFMVRSGGGRGAAAGGGGTTRG